MIVITHYIILRAQWSSGESGLGEGRVGGGGGEGGPQASRAAARLWRRWSGDESHVLLVSYIYMQIHDTHTYIWVQQLSKYRDTTDLITAIA